MFTGLIEAQGRITRLAPRGPGVQIGVHAGQAFVESLTVGDSVACDGACLTVVTFRPGFHGRCLFRDHESNHRVESETLSIWSGRWRWVIVCGASGHVGHVDTGSLQYATDWGDLPEFCGA